MTRIAGEPRGATPRACVLAARAAAVVMVGVAAFQVALVFGAPWGAYTQGGGTDGALDTSGRVVAAVSCAILLLMAAAILARVREGPLKDAPGRLVTVLAWFTTIYSALSVVLNLTTRSSSERAVFAPTAIAPLRARRDHDGRLSADPVSPGLEAVSCTRSRRSSSCAPGYPSLKTPCVRRVWPVTVLRTPLRYTADGSGTAAARTTSTGRFDR